jgi:hypothetical protein
MAAADLRGVSHSSAVRESLEAEATFNAHEVFAFHAAGGGEIDAIALFVSNLPRAGTCKASHLPVIRRGQRIGLILNTRPDVARRHIGAGAKGGAAVRKTSNSSTTYSYTATLAIAVCEGEITRINRVWADSKLLDLSQGAYRIYKGSETQLPDPLIESYQGVGATPAYRGLAYVVIEDFPLGSFGNRIPNFTFEVTRRAPQKDVGAQPVESLVKAIMLLPGSGEFVYDTQAEYKITGSTVAGNVVQSGYQLPLNLHTAEGSGRNNPNRLDEKSRTSMASPLFAPLVKRTTPPEK